MKTIPSIAVMTVTSSYTPKQRASENDCTHAGTYAKESELMDIMKVFISLEWNIAASVKDTLELVQHIAFAVVVR